MNDINLYIYNIYGIYISVTAIYTQYISEVKINIYTCILQDTFVV